MNISIIYTTTAVLSLLILAAYFILLKKKEPWFTTLFSAALIVNTGYLALSLSDTLNAALWANRFSYLGAVFLPLSMMMIILQTLKVNYSKWIPRVLIAISIIVFLIAASPGYLDIYYSDVTITKVHGATDLVKEYGPFHMLYYVYLAVYFLAMVVCILLKSPHLDFHDHLYSTILTIAVFVNIGVWLMGQLVDVNFEFLSISYVITGSFILLLKLLQMEFIKLQKDKKKIEKLVKNQTDTAKYDLSEEKVNMFIVGINTLTATEKKVFDLHVAKTSTKEILKMLDIKENTLKYHNKNIYSKLGVSSKKELVALANKINN